MTRATTAVMLVVLTMPPARAKEPVPLTVRSHDGWLSSLAFSPEGKHVLTGGDDGRVRLWCASSGKEVRSFRHGGSVTAVAYRADGRRIASGGWDGVVRVWEAGSGKELVTLRGHQESITCVAFSPDGTRLATGSGDDTLRVWSAATGQPLFTVELDDDYDVTCLAFSPDGKCIASGDGEKRITIWSAKDGEELLTLEGHDAAISCIAYSRDGKHIASGSWDRTVRVWGAESGKELLALKGHKQSVTSVAFSSDGQRIASGSEDRTVKVWSATGQELQTRGGLPDNVTAVVFSPDNSRLAASSKGRFLIWPVVAPAPTFERDIVPFVKKHCLACHGAQKQQAGIRFDRVTRYRAEEASLWTKAHEALRTGTMPPASRPRPDQAERGRFLAWVAKEQQTVAGKVRRLNRRELSAALQDLTGLAIDYAHALPGDSKLGGFDTGAEALQDAADSVDQVMKVTRRAVDAIRFVGPSTGEVYRVDLTTARDVRRAFEPWKERGVVFKGRGQIQAGKGLVLEPRWVGERDVYSYSFPSPKSGQGVLRLKLVVSAMKPMPGLPNPRLWVEVAGRHIDYREITAPLDKPNELVYEVQLDDLPVEGRSVRVSLSNKIEVPYAIKGYENQEMVRKGETVPGGTGLFRPVFDRRAAPDKQPAPFLHLHKIEVEVGHAAAWPPASWGAKVGPLKEDLASARRLLALWAERAWRRPVRAGEQERFVRLYQKLRGEKLSFDEALRATFQAVLLSSGFRYLPSPTDPDPVIARHAIASRLSFMLWGAPPDAELRRLAAAGKLRTPAEIDAQVDRLVRDPRADGFFRPFVLQWLEMEQPITIASSSLKKQDFRFARHLKASMREETIGYITELFRVNRPARGLIESDWALMNDILAVHYGYPGIEGGQLRRVPLRRDDPRGGGVLGHAGIQSMLCWMGGNWVIYRGAWVMRHLLDDPPPPPPLEVPELNPLAKANHGKTFKELLKQHQEDANCAVCHRKMDPIGFAFQNFDISGRWRDKEYDSYVLNDLDGKIEWRGTGKSRAVDTVGQLPRGEQFKSFAECKQLIVRNYQADLVRGLAKNLLVYATGRLPDVHDLAELRDVLERQRRTGYRLRDLTKAVLHSRAVLGR